MKVRDWKKCQSEPMNTFFLGFLSDYKHNILLKPPVPSPHWSVCARRGDGGRCDCLCRCAPIPFCEYIKNGQLALDDDAFLLYSVWATGAGGWLFGVANRSSGRRRHGRSDSVCNRGCRGVGWWGWGRNDCSTAVCWEGNCVADESDGFVESDESASDPNTAVEGDGGVGKNASDELRSRSESC